MKYDGIIVGGGPAGMFAAIIAAQRGNKVLLLERNDRLGKKLLITGKGRCNVTNACSSQEVLQNIPRNGRFLYSAMESFPPSAIMDFLETYGCALKVERGNRVFPVTDKSSSVLECLRNRMHRCGVQIKNARALQILTGDHGVTGVKTAQEQIYANWVILERSVTALLPGNIFLQRQAHLNQSFPEHSRQPLLRLCQNQAFGRQNPDSALNL